MERRRQLIIYTGISAIIAATLMKRDTIDLKNIAGTAYPMESLGTTMGGRIKGKLSYMSPEQLNQQSVDCRSDIWGLGVVTWELLTGRRLFRAASEGETVLSVLSRPIPPPSRFAGGVPRQLDAIVLRALSRDVETRYPRRVNWCARWRRS